MTTPLFARLPPDAVFTGFVLRMADTFGGDMHLRPVFHFCIRDNQLQHLVSLAEITAALSGKETISLAYTSPGLVVCLIVTTRTEDEDIFACLRTVIQLVAEAAPVGRLRLITIDESPLFSPQ